MLCQCFIGRFQRVSMAFTKGLRFRLQFQFRVEPESTPKASASSRFVGFDSYLKVTLASRK
uniref:Uncharacterized protein n=1 Tax=Picea glauca TaxID=3330 RepID=A0A117NIB8_PICGL|nr:hypothetical protein ABT39_MTgene2942 [Picea glauca]